MISFITNKTEILKKKIMWLINLQCSFQVYLFATSKQSKMWSTGISFMENIQCLA